VLTSGTARIPAWPHCHKEAGQAGRRGREDAIEQSKDGDQILQQLSRYRGLLIPIKDWPLALRQFEAKWTRYKRDLHLLDFTDLIEQCLRDVPVAPTNPTVIFADEAQDLNRMQLTLVRKWGERATTSSSLAMTTSAFFRSRVLLRTPSSTRTFRTTTRSSQAVVSRAQSVHRLADKLIRQLTRRQEKVYLARPEPGAVHRISNGTYKSPNISSLTAPSST